MSEQTAFDFLVPYNRPLLAPWEVARCLGRSIDHVYKLIDEGHLEAHAPKGREVQRYMITRRSVLKALAETSLYQPEDFIERIDALLATLTPEQLDRVAMLANKRRIKLLQSA